MFVADIISCVEFNADGELLATGDKGGRVVIFQRDQIVIISFSLLVFLLFSDRNSRLLCHLLCDPQFLPRNAL